MRWKAYRIYLTGLLSTGKKAIFVKYLGLCLAHRHISINPVWATVMWMGAIRW